MCCTTVLFPSDIVAQSTFVNFSIVAACTAGQAAVTVCFVFDDKLARATVPSSPSSYLTVADSRLFEPPLL
jgi:hypothetical protein